MFLVRRKKTREKKSEGIIVIQKTTEEKKDGKVSGSRRNAQDDLQNEKEDSLVRLHNELEKRLITASTFSNMLPSYFTVQRKFRIKICSFLA